MSGLSMMQAGASLDGWRVEAPQRDRVAELRAYRHQAQRFANPGRIAPNLQAMNSSLAEDTDDDEEGGFDAQQAQDDDEMQQIADEAKAIEQGEGLSALARVKSRIKGQAEDASQKMAQKIVEEAKERMNAVVVDVSADTATGVDQGNMLLIPSTAGVGIKATRVGLSIILKDSLSPTMKKGMSHFGIPVMSMTKITDVFAYVGFIMQAIDWTAIAAFLLPFVVILLLSLATCATQLDCSLQFGANLLGI